MVGTLDSQVIEKFKEFQKKTGKYLDLDIEKVKFNQLFFKDLHQKDKVSTQYTTRASKFIEISDINKETKRYNIKNKIKHNLPLKGKHAPKGTILISRVRPLLGGYTIIDGDDYTFTSGDLNPIVLPDEIYVNYVFKIICSLKFRTFLKLNQNTSGQKPTITDKLYNFDIVIPQEQKNYSSIDIQKVIVKFLEFWKFNYTDIFRKKVILQKPIIEKIKKAIIPAIFIYEKTLVNSFNEFMANKGLNINLENIGFQEVHITKLIEFSKGKNASLYTNNYILHNKGDIPVFSGKTKDNGVMGYVKEDENTYKYNKNIIFMTTVGKYAMTPKIIKGKFNLSQNCAIGTQLDDTLVEYLFIQVKELFEKIKKSRHNSQDSFTFDELKLDYLKDKKEQEFLVLIPSGEIQKLLVEFWKIIGTSINNKLKKFDKVSSLTNKIDEAFLYRTFNKIDWSK